jgi:hypothetical protein
MLTATTSKYKVITLKSLNKMKEFNHTSVRASQEYFNITGRLHDTVQQRCIDSAYSIHSADYNPESFDQAHDFRTELDTVSFIGFPPLYSH